MQKKKKKNIKQRVNGFHENVITGLVLNAALDVFVTVELAKQLFFFIVMSEDFDDIPELVPAVNNR